MSSDSLSKRSEVPIKTRQGRPPVYSEGGRIQCILQAAEKVFTTSGYGAATMEDVARTAGMSKRTLYEFYSDKRQLLAAITVAADDFPWDDADRIPLADPVAELRQRLLAAACFTLKLRQIRMSRLLIAEAEHAPELADNFFNRVMAKCGAYVTAAVERVGEEKIGPEIKDVHDTAMALLGATLGQLHLLVLFGKTAPPSSHQIGIRVDAAMQICGFKP